MYETQRRSSTNAWQSGHHHPTGTVRCLRCASQARIYMVYQDIYPIMQCDNALPGFIIGKYQVSQILRFTTIFFRGVPV
jgi:hypothetical protein